MHHQRKAARRRRRAPADREGATSLSAVFKRVLSAQPITAAVGLLLLFAAAALLMLTKDPGRHCGAVSIAVLYLTALVGGAVAVRLCHRRSPLLCGILEGAFLLIFCTVIGLFLPETWKSDVSGGFAVLMRALLIPTAVAGAFLGARRKRKRHR